MKRILLIIGMIAASVFVFAQSNEAGTIHLNGSFLLGTGSSQFKYEKVDVLSGYYSSFVFSFSGHYGVANNWSIGVDYNSGAYIFFDDDERAGGYSTNIRLEFRNYAINKDNIILYFTPTLGYLSLKDFKLPDDKFNGINLNVGAGFGWYFGGPFGINTEFHYETNALSYNKDENAKIITSGINFGLGFIVKI